MRFCSSLIVMTVAAALTFTSCNITDDIIDIHKEIDSLAKEDEAIALRLKAMEESVEAMRVIIDAINSGYYIKSVTPFTDPDGRTGNLCSFTNGNQIRIYDGVAGQDGTIPEIGAKKDAQGVYCWTIDGEFFTDAHGAHIPVSAAPDGELFIPDTTDMIPQFQIKDGFWFISFDYGVTWTQLGRSTGKEGLDGEDGIDNIIRIDQNSEDCVSFVLLDGTVISIPYYKDVRVILDLMDNIVPIAGRETIKIGYSLTSAEEGTFVSVSSDGYYSVRAISTSPLEGNILVNCPRSYRDGFVNVMVNTKNGVTDMEVIRFRERVFDFPEGMDFTIPYDGGTVRVPFSANFEYEIAVDPSCDEWLSAEVTEGEGLSQELVITVLHNSKEARSGTVNLYSDNSIEPFARVIISQESPYCIIDKASHIITYEGGTFITHLTTSYPVSIVPPEVDWVRAEVFPGDVHEYDVVFTVDPNGSEDARRTEVKLVSTIGSRPLANVLLQQRGRNNDLEMAMVITVRPNYSNDFTAYLPIDVSPCGDDYPLDCFIDWGDGTPGEHVTMNDRRWELPESERAVHHKYENLDVGREFEVIISGTVSSLCADYIPKAFRSSVTEVKQWGKLGLKRMHNAFEGFTGLETLHPDETGAFSEVVSFEYAFSNCPRLKTISEHLFAYASKADNFSYTFSGCSSLVSVPEHLFSNCSEARYFSGVFRDCTSLLNIPEDLFDGCRKVERMSEAFAYCKIIRSIPEKLFSGCQELVSLDYVFQNCRNIEEIPVGLFASNKALRNLRQAFEGLSITSIPPGLLDSCPKIEEISGLFLNCNLLRTVPVNLFDNQRKILYFEHTFCECPLRGESPYTVLEDGTKVHFYERALYPEHFVTPLRHSYCFAVRDRMLTDIDNIPFEWIENYR